MRTKTRQGTATPELQPKTGTSKGSEEPLVFISHDSRDAELAEAFSKLLKTVSAGMLKAFWSSDKKGTEGIEFGDEWYKALMSKLEVASDVVCLLTERSIERPWLLYEAGVAKGKLDTPVHGVALGIPLNRVTVGPFFQFQNSDDGEDSLTKLVLQLCRRITGLDPDEGVVKGQVQAFKKSVAEVLKKIGQKREGKQEEVDATSVAKVLEEMKLIVRDLPGRFEQRLVEGSERVRFRKFPFRRVHPVMIEEMARAMSTKSGDPVAILIAASLLKDDYPWLYEMGMDAYRAFKSLNPRAAEPALRRFQNAAEVTQHGPWADELVPTREAHILLRDVSRLLDHFAHIRLEGLANRRALASEEEEGKK